MADKTIFDFLNAIFYKKYIPYDKNCNSYLLSLWLSHDGQLIDIVNTINEFQFLLPDCKIYEYYYYKVPQGKRYLKWVKKEDKLDEKKKEKLDEMRAEFMLSKKEMEIYKNFGLTNIKKNDNVKKDVKNASSIFL